MTSRTQCQAGLFPWKIKFDYRIQSGIEADNKEPASILPTPKEWAFNSCGKILNPASSNRPSIALNRSICTRFMSPMTFSKNEEVDLRACIQF